MTALTTVMPEPTRWAPEPWLCHDLPLGTARVGSICPVAHDTVLRLCFPFDASIELAVDALPDPDAAALVRLVMRPLAVLLCRRGEQLHCSVIGTAKGGPRRTPVTLGAALALCDSGVNTVVRCEGARRSSVA
jgi:hypothetical protein